MRYWRIDVLQLVFVLWFLAVGYCMGFWTNLVCIGCVSFIGAEADTFNSVRGRCCFIGFNSLGHTPPSPWSSPCLKSCFVDSCDCLQLTGGMMIADFFRDSYKQWLYLGGENRWSYGMSYFYEEWPSHLDVLVHTFWTELIPLVKSC